MHETITISPTDLARGEAAALDALTALLDAAQYHAGIAGLLRLVADAKRRNIERRKKLAEENLADFSVPNNAAIARRSPKPRPAGCDGTNVQRPTG